MTFSVNILDPSNYTANYDIGLCNALHDIGCDVHLWTSNWHHEDLSCFEHRYQRHEVFFKLSEWEPIRSRMWVRRGAKVLEYPSGLRKVFASLKHSNDNKTVVHFEWSFLPKLDRRFWRRLNNNKYPIVYTAHNVLPHNHTPSDIPNYKWFYEHADRIIVHAEDNKREMVETLSVPDDKIRVVPIGTFSPFLDAFPRYSREKAREELGLGMDDLVVLFFGNISPYKGLNYLIDAMGQVTKKIPNLYLVITGDFRQSSYTEYQKQIEQIGISDSVIIHPRFVTTNLNSLYFMASDVTVLPYVKSYQSIVGYMAYANRCPTIVTNTGGLSDVTEHELSGYVVPTENSAELAKAIERFFSLSREQRKGMGEYGYQSVERRFSWDNVAKGTRSVYEELF